MYFYVNFSLLLLWKFFPGGSVLECLCLASWEWVVEGSNHGSISKTHHINNKSVDWYALFQYYIAGASINTQSGGKAKLNWVIWVHPIMAQHQLSLRWQINCCQISWQNKFFNILFITVCFIFVFKQVNERSCVGVFFQQR